MKKLRFEKNNLSSRILSHLFFDDQRNIVFFAISLAIPAIILCIYLMIILTCRNPKLLIFNIPFGIFLIWAIYKIYKMLSILGKSGLF